MFKVKNRPLSPHLTIYTGQFTSIYSIWHRITGIILFLTVIFILFICKTSSYIFLSLNLISYFLELSLWIKNGIFLNFLVIFLYHLTNGLRHISWDLGFNLILTSVKKTARINTLALSLLIIITIQNITMI